MLTIEWTIKFRFLRRDIAKVVGSFHKDLGVPIPPFEKVLVNERGVWIKVVIS